MYLRCFSASYFHVFSFVHLRNCAIAIVYLSVEAIKGIMENEFCRLGDVQATFGLTPFLLRKYVSSKLRTFATNECGNDSCGPSGQKMKSALHILIVLLFAAIVFMEAGAQTNISQKRNMDPVRVERHDSLTVYYPDYSRIDLVTGQMPSKSEKEVIFVCAAAFTGERLKEFRHNNIAGNHVSAGEYFQGFKCGPNNGVFTWSTKTGWHFYNYGHQNSVTPLKAIAKEGGMGFCQSMLFYNGKQFKGCFKPDRANQYRALCEIGGKLCIVDCARSLPFGSFMEGLRKLGVRNAVYCDMGTGWNYSWYRKADGSVKEIFSTPGQYTTNWVVFYRE